MPRLTFTLTRRREVDDENWRIRTIGGNGGSFDPRAAVHMPTFELNKAIVQKAEHYHFDFALSMIKLRGFGGKLSSGDYNLSRSPDGGAGGRDLAHSGITPPPPLPRYLQQSSPVWPQPSTQSLAGVLASTS